MIVFMAFDNSTIFFFCALGVFNCFLVSIYFLFFRKRPYVRHTLFGLLTLLLSLRVGKTLYMFFSGAELLVAQIGLSACFLIGVALYYYLKAVLEKREDIPKSWVVHSGILLLIIVTVGLVKPYSSNISFWHDYFVWFIYLIWGGYICLSAYELKDILKRLGKKPKQVSTSDTWLTIVFIGNALIFLSYVIGYFWLHLVEMLTFSIVFYTLIFFFLYKRDRDSIFQKTPEKYAQKIDLHEAKSLSERLTKLMKEEQLYKNPNLKLRELASRMNISQHKLSQLLNDNIGENFNNYINRLRTENAISILRTNKVFTLEAIGYESGFASKSGFYSTFKRLTGKTPSHFRRQLG